MNMRYFVTVLIGQYAFTKEFDTDTNALHCFDSMSVDNGEAIEGNWLTRPGAVGIDTVTVARVPPETKIGDPNRQ